MWILNKLSECQKFWSYTYFWHSLILFNIHTYIIIQFFQHFFIIISTWFCPKYSNVWILIIFLAWKLATIPKTFKKYPVGQYGMFARYVHSSFQRHGLFRKTQLHSSWFGCQKLSCWFWKCCQSELYYLYFR